MLKASLFIGFLLLIASISGQDLKKRSLGDGWKMKITSGPAEAQQFINKQYDITVPSTIHLNLQKYKVIPDPFFSDNIRRIEWISSCFVTFKTDIVVTEEQLKYSKARLVFEGIDTYSNIVLNGKELGETINAFLKYEFQVKQLLKIGANSLFVNINSTKGKDSEGQRLDRMPFEYAHTRKACYQYSWDWAPYMNTMGIWLPVSIIFYNQVKFDYIWVRNKALTEKLAVLDVVVALDVQSKQRLGEVQLNFKLKSDVIDQTFSIISKYSSVQININNPQLWWPNGIGRPHVYQLQFSLKKDNNILDYRKIVYGIRTVQLNEADSKFKLLINGYPIYCKGANYVPPDMMYPRTINPEFQPKNTFRNLLQDSVASNFNMLRVWGGGQYEIDEFYELASRKGIMIFQDFMFSDSIYPSNDAFMVNVRDEVIYQVRRLRNYPCLVLWSGNNQILQGIQTWGWGQPNYVSSYEKVFKQLIPNIINVESKHLPYIESSPSKGVGNTGFNRGGDVHYWGVWAAQSPFQTYETAVGGFNSQFGTQALPVWQSIKQFTTQMDRNYESTVFASHQRHSSGFRTLQLYNRKYAHNSLNFLLESYVSGLVQAYAIQIAIRAQRLQKPNSMGTLYWQLNDAWPSISWSSIDYYGRWKPLQFKAKLLFKDVILFYNSKNYKITAINDKLHSVDANYLVKVMNFDGKVLFKDEGNIMLGINQNKYIFTIPQTSVRQTKNTFVYSQISYGDHEDNKTILTTFLSPFINLALQSTTLNVKLYPSNNYIQVSSSYLIKNLYISNNKYDLKLSDNYFDVVPRHSVKVYFYNTESLQILKPTMDFKSYRQVYDPSPLDVKIIQ